MFVSSGVGSADSIRDRSSIAARVHPGVAFLAAAAGIQLVYVVQPIWFLNQFVLTVDDAYYFLEIARNLAHLGWSTFDGLHATNGVQLLWTMVLGGLSVVFDDRMALIRAALVACILLNVGTGLLLRRFGTIVHSNEVGEAVAVLWSLMMLWPGTGLTGMEYSLHTAVLALLLLCWWRIMIESPIPPRLAVLAGLAATLNFWTRLDAAVFSLIVLATATLRVRSINGSGWRMDLLRLWMLPITGAAAYVLLSLAMGGTLMPVSGIVKGVYAAEHFDGYPWWVALAGHVSWWGRVLLQPAADIIAALFARRVSVLLSPAELAVAGGIAVAVSAWGIRNLWLRGNHRTRRATSFAAVLLALGALHAAVVVIQVGHFSHTTRHYYAWLSISACLWAALLLTTAARRFGFRTGPNAVAAAGVLIALQAWGVAGMLSAPMDPLALRNARTELIAWIDANLPPGEPIGSWNAGQFGYFLDRPVVNLDGLVNDASFAGSLRRGEPIVAYLNQRGVRYVVDYNEPDLSMPFRANWDRDLLFRNEIPWSDVERVQERRTSDRTLYVLQLKR